MTGFIRNGLTGESKAHLRKTVRGLRETLIAQLKDSAEQRYLLSVPLSKAAATLDAATLERRRRLETALDQAALEDGGGKEARARAFVAAAKEAGATLLNRLVLVRHLEALGLSKPSVLTGGWMSKGYREFQQVAAALCEDETQGMAPLLDLLFAELAMALPGLFGDVGLTSLLPVPASTLRQAIEALDEIPVEAWRDDLTLGWVYQFWNDPDREALDAKINASGKIEPHEIASKTQMFTERYMVEWLLQNSLGPTWLAMCKKHGWAAEVESSGVLAQLDARRAEWRKKREAGEVAADALMPTSDRLEEAWKYYVPQPMPAAVVEHAPESVRELKLLDPACGSGHFLVVAFDLLAELYREESRHRGESWNDRQIAEWILENNLHGVDIDPRAVQIAAAAVYLKARALAKDADPKQVNLVAPALKLSALAKDDAGLAKLEADIHRETGIPSELTRQLIATLEGVDHLGSLLKVGDAIDKALEAHEGAFTRASAQADLFKATRAPDPKPLHRDAAKKIVRQRLEGFLAKHAGAEDLGLRLRGQQLTAGLRFASIVKEGEYHLVVGNPPYQGTSKMKNAGYVAKNYPMGKSDLYAAFLERGLQLCRPGGASAMVTMRSWMFLSGFTALREHLLRTFDLRILGDVDRGAFDEVPNEVLATAMSVFRRSSPATEASVAMQPTPLSDKSYDRARTGRKRAAVLLQVGRFEHRPSALTAVPGSPILYWWTDTELDDFRKFPGLGTLAPARFGVNTGNNTRFLRKHWEVQPTSTLTVPSMRPLPARSEFPRFVRYLKGARGLRWIDPCDDICVWSRWGLELKLYAEYLYGSYTRQIRNEGVFFRPGIAFTMLGNEFSARLHRWRCVIDSKGSSIYPPESEQPKYLRMLNSTRARRTLGSLNPTLSFQVGDVNRLPVTPQPDSSDLMEAVAAEFSLRESCREGSSEFRKPCPHDWEGIQDWAQLAADADEPPPLELARKAPELTRRLSFAFGVSIGRFDAQGAGILESAPETSVAEGIFFLSERGGGDGIDNPASELRVLSESNGREWLRNWLRSEFWEFLRQEYENRPIYFPLASSKRCFVAFVSIHRWSASTLTTLLTDYLIPERKALEGSLADLRVARSSGDKKSRTEVERQFAQQSKWLEELEDFIAKVTQCAEKGPPSDPGTPAREVDAPYVMDLDDGVMVNAAALWPLLEPMWKDPKKWWKELATAKGRKDYDWSHLAARYFPTRVDEKCRQDPSLAVAHGCFWKYHPEVAYQWELRLQDEIGPDFLINEKDSGALRAAFLKRDPKRAAELVAAEKARRDRKSAKQDQEAPELDADAASSEEEDAA